MRSHAFLAIAALLLTSVAVGAPPSGPTLRTYAFHVTSCGTGCTAYNGTVPGPTIDVNVGDTVEVTLYNDVADPVSFHTHGVVIPSTMDGIAPHPDTLFSDSSAPPGGSFTYRFRTMYAGTWHYHDHVMGGMEGARGVEEGLYGSLVVRSGGEVRPTTLDLHLLDTGANGGRGLNATVPAGQPFEVEVVSLGNEIWTVVLAGQTVEVGPGESGRISVASASGSYTWTATSFPSFMTQHGTVSAP